MIREEQDTIQWNMELRQFENKDHYLSQPLFDVHVSDDVTGTGATEGFFIQHGVDNRLQALAVV